MNDRAILAVNMKTCVHYRLKIELTYFTVNI